MNRHDLNLAFYRKLTGLAIANMIDVRPDEIEEPASLLNSQSWRRGVVMLNEPEPIAWGDGVYSRIHGLYQIDIYVPRAAASAFKVASEYSDAHVAHFFPANGRGITVTENQTSAHIVRRPSQRHLGREGAYLRDVVEVDFYLDVPAEA